MAYGSSFRTAVQKHFTLLFLRWVSILVLSNISYSSSVSPALWLNIWSSCFKVPSWCSKSACQGGDADQETIKKNRADGKSILCRLLQAGGQLISLSRILTFSRNACMYESARNDKEQRTASLDLMIDVWEQIQYYKEIIFSNFVAGLKIIV